MAYTHGTKWSEALIQKSLLYIINETGIDYMPTRKEIAEFYGNEALTNKISKTYGYYGWAKKLNLPIKNSCTTFAKKFERKAAKILEEQGFQTALMPQNFPYDLLINNKIKIDIKAAHLHTTKDDCKFYSFAIRKDNPTCDIYMCMTVKDNSVGKVFIIPSHVLQGQTQVSIGEKSIYDRYIDKFNLINDLDAAFLRLTP